MKHIKLKIKKTQRMKKDIHQTKMKAPEHIVVWLLKNSIKEGILRATAGGEGRRMAHYIQRNKGKSYSWSSSETTQAEDNRVTSLKCWKKKAIDPEFYTQ